jgi:hypothetical protein
LPVALGLNALSADQEAKAVTRSSGEAAGSRG